MHKNIEILNWILKKIDTSATKTWKMATLVFVCNDTFCY